MTAAVLPPVGFWRATLSTDGLNGRTEFGDHFLNRFELRHRDPVQEKLGMVQHARFLGGASRRHPVLFQDSEEQRLHVVEPIGCLLEKLVHVPVGVRGKLGIQVGSAAWAVRTSERIRSIRSCVSLCMRSLFLWD